MHLFTFRHGPSFLPNAREFEFSIVPLFSTGCQTIRTIPSQLSLSRRTQRSVSTHSQPPLTSPSSKRPHQASLSCSPYNSKPAIPHASLLPFLLLQIPSSPQTPSLLFRPLLHPLPHPIISPNALHIPTSPPPHLSTSPHPHPHILTSPHPHLPQTPPNPPRTPTMQDNLQDRSRESEKTAEKIGSKV